MGKQILTQARLKELLHYDPDTGIFTRRYNIPNCHIRAGDVAGHKNQRGYVVIKLFQQAHKAHRLAFLYMTGSFPENEVDHVKHIKHDNRWAKLCEATRTDNNRNRSTPHNNRSGIQGVYWRESARRWVAQIRQEPKNIHLYQGPDFFEACCARKAAEVKYGYHENHGASKNQKRRTHNTN